MALGGSSLRELPPPGDATVETGTPVALLLLETKATPKSSLSKSTTSTLFPLLRRAGAGVDAMANGTAAMGEERWTKEESAGKRRLARQG